MRKVEAVELVACHVFHLADRDDRSVSMGTTSPSCSLPATESAERGQAVLSHGSTTSMVEIARRRIEGSEHDRVSRDKRGRFEGRRGT